MSAMSVGAGRLCVKGQENNFECGGSCFMHAHGTACGSLHGLCFHSVSVPPRVGHAANRTLHMCSSMRCELLCTAQQWLVLVQGYPCQRGVNHYAQHSGGWCWCRVILVSEA
jgi:hypothetical protein